MRVRGRRLCLECETAWSYFDAGEITCPNCGSMWSRGLDRNRTLHTDSPVELDLEEARQLAADRPLSEVASTVADAARSYLARRGFIHEGDLGPLDDQYVRAAELRQVAAALGSRLDPDASAERYFLTLLAADEDHPEAVPPSLRQAHGLASVRAVEAYATDLGRWLRDHPDDAGRDCLGRLRDHVRRGAALDGDIPPDDADRLLDAARALGDYLRPDGTVGLDRVRHGLDELD